jgi:hypothetical protein
MDKVRKPNISVSRTSPQPLSQMEPMSSDSVLLYDWRFTSNQFVLVLSPLRFTTIDSLNFAAEPLQSYSLCNIPSCEYASMLLKRDTIVCFEPLPNTSGWIIIIPERQRRRPLLGKSGNHFIATAGQQPLCYCVRVSKYKCFSRLLTLF